MIKADLVVVNIGELLTCRENATDYVGLLKKQAITICGDKIAAIGSDNEIQPMITENTVIIDARGNVVAPGFVDCHTHVVFAGSRVDEYTAILDGASQEEIRRRGIKTGIFASVEATRSLPEEDLYAQAKSRVISMALSGTTTLESKSGYGLDCETEMKQLRVTKKLGDELPIKLVPTYLGGHGWPPNVGKNNYMKFMAEEMIPKVAESGLAEFYDLWCEDIAYSYNDCKYLLAIAKQHGLKLKMHTDQHSYIGGTDLAAENGVTSVDHLNYTPRFALKKLAKAGVIGVVLPSVDFTTKISRPFDSAIMIEEKLEIGLATNCCPACWCTSIPFVIQLGCRNHGLTPARAIRAATLGGAKAIDRSSEVGSIEVGKIADLQIWNISRYEDIAYRVGCNPVDTVICNGQVSIKKGN